MTTVTMLIGGVKLDIRHDGETINGIEVYDMKDDQRDLGKILLPGVLDRINARIAEEQPDLSIPWDDPDRKYDEAVDRALEEAGTHPTSEDALNTIRREGMAITAKENGGDYERPANGMYRAVCVNVFDIGDQMGYGGKIQHQIVVLWEIDALQTKGERVGKRFLLTKKYTLSLNEKAHLRHDLESWRGRPFTPEELAGFDVEKVVGINCLLNIMEETSKTGKTWSNVKAVTPPMQGQERLVAETDKTFVPKWVEAKLHPDASQGSASADNFDDDIPF
jgi:hypothetical protein